MRAQKLPLFRRISVATFPPFILARNPCKIKMLVAGQLTDRWIYMEPQNSSSQSYQPNWLTCHNTRSGRITLGSQQQQGFGVCVEGVQSMCLSCGRSCRLSHSPPLPTISQRSVSLTLDCPHIPAPSSGGKEGKTQVWCQTSLFVWSPSATVFCSILTIQRFLKAGCQVQRLPFLHGDLYFDCLLSVFTDFSCSLFGVLSASCGLCFECPCCRCSV